MSAVRARCRRSCVGAGSHGFAGARSVGGHVADKAAASCRHPAARPHVPSSVTADAGVACCSRHVRVAVARRISTVTGIDGYCDRHRRVKGNRVVRRILLCQCAAGRAGLGRRPMKNAPGTCLSAWGRDGERGDMEMCQGGVTNGRFRGGSRRRGSRSARRRQAAALPNVCAARDTCWLQGRCGPACRPLARTHGWCVPQRAAWCARVSPRATASAHTRAGVRMRIRTFRSCRRFQRCSTRECTARRMRAPARTRQRKRARARECM